MFFICSKSFKINFQRRIWNYPNRKYNYFSHFQASDQKTSFTKWFSIVPRDLKLIFKTGNGNIQTGNRIITPTSMPLIKNFFCIIFLICSKGLKNNFLNRKRNYSNWKWNYFSHFQASDKKLI